MCVCDTDEQLEVSQGRGGRRGGSKSVSGDHIRFYMMLILRVTREYKSATTADNVEFHR